MYLIPVSAISGAALGPVVERRFLALHTTLKHDPVAGLITVKFTRSGEKSLRKQGNHLLMVPAVRSEAWSGGKLLLDAAVDTGREMQLNVKPSDLMCRSTQDFDIGGCLWTMQQLCL